MTTTREWIDAHAVGFGTVAFMVLKGGQWATEPITVTRRVPGGNGFFTQFLGRGPARATYDLKFASIDTYAAFLTLLGTAAMLTLPVDVAAIPDRVAAVIVGQRYDQLANTVLETIDAGSVRFLNGGVVECSATFIRAVSDLVPAELWPGGG